MTSGQRPPSSPRGLSGLCFAPKLVRCVRQKHNKPSSPVAYCPPGSRVLCAASVIVLEDCHMLGKMFNSVYRLGEDGDLKNEGDGMLSVWALRARSYKTKAEA